MRFWRVCRTHRESISIQEVDDNWTRASKVFEKEFISNVEKGNCVMKTQFELIP